MVLVTLGLSELSVRKVSILNEVVCKEKCDYSREVHIVKNCDQGVENATQGLCQG